MSMTYLFNLTTHDLLLTTHYSLLTTHACEQEEHHYFIRSLGYTHPWHGGQPPHNKHA